MPSGEPGIVRRAREDTLSRSHRPLYKNLDGVRAIAALMVLVSHSQWGPPAFGGSGVWLFFVLSGFLLFPTLPQHADALFPRRLAGFLVKRITRLIPLYYFALLIYSAKWHMPPGWLLQHLLFLDAQTFFWTVKIEVIFYLLLPFIGLVSCLIRGTLPKFLILVAITLAYHFLVQVPALVTVRAAVTTVPLWLSPFMMGICASVIAPYLSKPIGYACLVAGAIALAVLNFDLPSFVHIRDFFLGVHPGSNGPFVFVGATALMATLFVTGAAVIPPNFLFCNRIIRTAGVCGYSFYIWQILVMQLLTDNFDIPSRPLLFALTAVLTYFVSIVSFALIELPAMNYGHARGTALDRGPSRRWQARESA